MSITSDKELERVAFTDEVNELYKRIDKELTKDFNNGDLDRTAGVQDLKIHGYTERSDDSRWAGYFEISCKIPKIMLGEIKPSEAKQLLEWGYDEENEVVEFNEFIVDNYVTRSMVWALADDEVNRMRTRADFEAELISTLNYFWH